MKIRKLNGLGFPNIAVYEDGRIFDEYRNKEISSNGNKVSLMSEMGYTKDFTHSKLIKWCFNHPARNYVKYKSLNIVGCSKYLVTYDGRIFGYRNLDYLSPNTTHDGYKTVNLLDDNGKWTPWRVHRLVALAFVPNPENKDTINHIDGNKDNNCADNLEWVWMWENIDHRGKMYGGPTEEKIREICKYLESGYTQTQAAKMAGVGRHIVKDIQYGSHYRITKDYNIPRYSNQKRAPVELTRKEFIPHGQQNRTHEIHIDLSSTTIPKGSRTKWFETAQVL